MPILISVGIAVAGALGAAQAPLNSLIAEGIGPYKAASVAMIIGAIMLGMFSWVGPNPSAPVEGGSAASVAIYLLSGLFGAIYVTTILAAVPAVGAAAAFSLVIFGQLLASVIVDSWGLFGASTATPSGPRLFGLAVVLGGSWVVVASR